MRAEREHTRQYPDKQICSKSQWISLCVLHFGVLLSLGEVEGRFNGLYLNIIDGGL